MGKRDPLSGCRRRRFVGLGGRGGTRVAYMEGGLQGGRISCLERRGDLPGASCVVWDYRLGWLGMDYMEVSFAIWGGGFTRGLQGEWFWVSVGGLQEAGCATWEREDWGDFTWAYMGGDIYMGVNRLCCVGVVGEGI